MPHQTVRVSALSPSTVVRELPRDGYNGASSLRVRYLTARQLVHDVGPTLLRLHNGGPGIDEPLKDIAIYAPGAPAPLGPGCIVLGIGLNTAAQLLEAIAAMNCASAKVLALKAPHPAVPGAAHVTVIEVDKNASWIHVASTVRERFLDHARAHVRSDDHGLDLFNLAGAIYAALGAPVTIEDRFSALVAWSAGQDSTDPERVETILGRAVQPRTLAEQRERGEFVRLHASPDPVYFESAEAGQLARMAIAVRAGPDVVGYIWAVVTQPFDDEKNQRLREFADVAALHLIERRPETNYSRRHRAEHAAAVLGGSGDSVQVSRLQLGNGPVCVVAAAPRDIPAKVGATDSRGTAHSAARLHRFADELEFSMAAVHPHSAVVVGTAAVYALVPWLPGHASPQEMTATMMRDFLARTPTTDGFRAVVGGPANSLNGIFEARVQADAALRALLHPIVQGEPVRTVADCALWVLLLHLADVTESLAMPSSTGALCKLNASDGQDGLLSTTLTAYFDAAGSTDSAARALHIHPNTMRYRMRRIREISGLDFEDADALLLAQLQIRVNALLATRNQ